MDYCSDPSMDCLGTLMDCLSSLVSALLFILVIIAGVALARFANARIVDFTESRQLWLKPSRISSYRLLYMAQSRVWPVTWAICFAKWAIMVVISLTLWFLTPIYYMLIGGSRASVKRGAQAIELAASGIEGHHPRKISVP